MTRIDRRSIVLLIRVGLFTAVALASAAPAILAGAPLSPSVSLPADTLPSGTFAVTDVRVFDGVEVREAVTVLVEGGRITAMAPGLDVPGGTPWVEGGGRTLLPGLVDAHVHTFDPAALSQALAFGVVLHLDMFTNPDALSRWRAEQAGDGAPGRADILGPGFLATAPGGHGTQFGLPVPTLASAEDARPWVAARAAEGADYIKIILEDGSAHGMTFANLDDATFRAVVAAAHHEGLLAVVHVSTVADAERALEAGADGLVHLWVDAAPGADVAERMAEAGMFVVPTLTVLEGLVGIRGGASLLDEEGFAELLDAGARQSLTSSHPPSPVMSWEVLQESLRVLTRAGVPIVVGSDAPNPGTTYGASVHRELELLVQAGLSPLDALRSATSVPARAFRLYDRGRIEPGVRADLVLVEGDPSRDIRATRRIVGVWKSGQAVDRQEIRERALASVREAEAPAEAPDLGTRELLVSDFEDGTMAAALGMGWSETTDGMMGGGSTVSLGVVDGGIAGTGRSLRVAGEVAPGLPFAWSGAMYFPGSQPMRPVDLSGASGLAFHIRGSGPGFQVFVFSRDGGPLPATLPLEVEEEWREVLVRWEDLPGGDASAITGIAVVAGPAPGDFEFWLDRILLR